MMEDTPATRRNVRFNWAREDIEQRFRVYGGRFTDTNAMFTLVVGLIGTVAFYLLAHFATLIPWLAAMAEKFTDRGPTPYAIVLFFAWSMAILWVKRHKLSYQRKLLTVAIVPPERSFILNQDSARKCLDHLERLTDSPKNFMLLNRVEIALSSLENLGNLNDVSAILSAQATQDEERVASSYTLLAGFVWAIPVFGFIGTVLGLGEAIEGFGATLANAEDIEAIRVSMKGVVSGLATAFDTTLVGLVATVILQVMIGFARRSEAQFLDACDEYCQQNVLRKLRLED